MVKELFKSGIYDLLKLIKESEGINPSALEKKLIKKVGMSANTVYKRINTLARLGIINFDFGVSEKGRPAKICKLTPLGKKIVQHIEEMEREFEDYHRKRSFPDTVEEFIDKELENDNNS